MPTEKPTWQERFAQWLPTVPNLEWWETLNGLRKIRNVDEERIGREWRDYLTHPGRDPSQASKMLRNPDRTIHAPSQRALFFIGRECGFHWSHPIMSVLAAKCYGEDAVDSVLEFWERYELQVNIYELISPYIEVEEVVDRAKSKVPAAARDGDMLARMIQFATSNPVLAKLLTQLIEQQSQLRAGRARSA